VKKALFAFACGAVFGVGLLVSQMTNPAKVIGFLDITGAWDPSLAFVMGGALAVFGTAYLLSRRAGARPLLDARFYVPGAQGITWQLVVGSLLFGVGWGLAGFCPGPALVSAGFGDTRVWTFVAAMAVGIFAFNWTGRKNA
jgi:uncharacterized membrane protein YedE/YeeE